MLDERRSGEAAARPDPAASSAATAAKRPRDQRLDFYRGLAMFIILMAHIPGNLWALWIPARFGFSDATEIFVFCSGFASSLAFGAVFMRRGFGLGTARIVFRIWQVYWCHVGIILVAATIAWTIRANGLDAAPGDGILHRPYVVPLFERTGEALLGLLTLTWVPGLFDILPMYLVILALVPVVMGAHRLAGRPGVAVVVLGLWALATLAGLARQSGAEDWTGTGGAMAGWLAASAPWLAAFNLPGEPWEEGTWYFNPFAWQLVFFLGFAFGMRWLPAPPRSRALMWAAIAVLVASVPLAWHEFYAYLTSYWPQSWGGEWLWNTRYALEPFWWKSWLGAFRVIHFLALAYLAWLVAGEGGERLSRGFEGREAPAALWRIGPRIAGAVAVLTIPYAYEEEITALAPALDAFLYDTVPIVPARWLGLLQLIHLIALAFLGWAALGRGRRAKALGPWFRAVVPVIRKVGTQSLAVFVVSIPLAVALGAVLDHTGREMVPTFLVNVFGAGLLIATAYGVGWFRKQPWKAPAAGAT